MSMTTFTADERTATPVEWAQTDLYRFFALIFGPPRRECFEFLSQRSASLALKELWALLKCPGKFPGFEWFESYDLYESAYIALFDVGAPEPPVPLFESAHDKSHPAQEIALENTYFYEVLSLKADPGCSVPDYLITQLEFLSAMEFVLENSSEEATIAGLARAKREFIERHLLNWVPAAKVKLGKTGAPGFSVLMTMLEGLLCLSEDAELDS